MALEVSVNEIESAAVGGPGSEGMKALIEKMGKADRTFPREPDEALLVRAFLAFTTHKDTELFKELGIAISAKRFATMTSRLLDSIEIMQAQKRIAAKRASRDAQQVPA
jgi:hypothetical protein